MLIPYNDTACIVCVIAGRGTVTPYTLILRTLSRCTQLPVTFVFDLDFVSTY